MKIAELDFSFNSVLAPLADIVPPADDDKTLNINIKAFEGTDLAEPISIFYEQLTGKKLTEDEAIFALVARKDKPNKLYGPALYQDEGKFVIRWGNTFVPMVLEGGTLRPEANEEAEFVVQPSAETRIGQYKEACLIFSLIDFGEYDEILMPICFKRADWEIAFDERQIATALRKNDVQVFQNLLAQINKNGGGVSADGDNTLLPQGVDLKVIAAYPRNTKFGVNYIFTVQADPELGIEKDLNIWAFGDVKKKFKAGGVVSEEKPGILNFTATVNDKGEKRYNISFDVDWGEAKGVVKMQQVLGTW